MAEESTQTTGTAKGSSRSTAAGGSSPDEELKNLKAAMEQDQADAAKLKKQMDERKAKIEAFEKAMAATKQVSNGFASTLQGFSADRLEIQDFLANELPLIERQDDVKNKKAEIEAAIKQANAKIETKETERLTLEQKSHQEMTALQTVSDDLAGKKAGLAELQNLQRAVSDKFSVLKKLSQRIKGEAAGKPLVKYVLGLEMKTVWDDTKKLLMTKEQLESAYYAKAEEVRAAAAAASAQEEKYKLAQSAVEAATKDLDASRTGRLDDIVKQVGALAPAPPGGAPVGAGAAARPESCVL
jgi:chromosome segregation ATPase